MHQYTVVQFLSSLISTKSSLLIIRVGKFYCYIFHLKISWFRSYNTDFTYGCWRQILADKFQMPRPPKLKINHHNLCSVTDIQSSPLTFSRHQHSPSCRYDAASAFNKLNNLSLNLISLKNLFWDDPREFS